MIVGLASYEIGEVVMGFEKVWRCVLRLHCLQKPIDIVWLLS
jgi:hypothetical protein